MKRLKPFLIFSGLLFFFSCASGPSGNTTGLNPDGGTGSSSARITGSNQPDEEQRTKQAVTALIEICRSGDFKKAEQYILFADWDQDPPAIRKGDYRIAADRRNIDFLCSDISETLAAYEEYALGDFYTDSESEGVFYICEVELRSADDYATIEFIFFQLDHYFGLIEVDS